MFEILNYYYIALANIEYIASMALIFLTVALTVGSVIFLLTRRNVLRERVTKFAPSNEFFHLTRSKLIDEEEDSGFVAKVTTPLHKVVAPSAEATQKKTRLTLIQAGFRSKAAYRNYLALRVLCGIGSPLGYLFAIYYYQFSLQAILLCFSAASVGFYLPVWAVRYFTRRRRTEISRALPDALDVMVVCGEAGLGLDMIIRRVGEEIRPLSRHLSDELSLTNLEIQAGKPRDEAFRNMSARIGVAEVGNLLGVLGQASRFGTGIAQALRVHAEGLRVKRRQIAEERAAKLTVKLLFPLIFCIFPALFVVLVGPAVIRIARDLLPNM